MEDLQMITRAMLRSLLLAAALFCGAGMGCLCGEPSGGAGTGTNPARATATARRQPALPWPEPNANAVAQIKKELRAQLNDEFQIIQVGPWIVATDLPAEEAPTFTEHTIGRFAADVQRQLFTKTLRTDPLKVYLFRDKISYETWHQTLFHEKPGTPFGYFSRQRNAMVMNIGTGGGTLLHEMVHAMSEPDFPGIPAWLNEGLGSLFEASSRSRAGKVIGVTNWRLTGLQEELKKGTQPKIKDLLAMSDSDFYGARSGANYAMARYLMQYLQEQGHVEEFYTRIRDRKDADAFATLRAVFGNKKTVEQIADDCVAWVKTLILEPRY